MKTFKRALSMLLIVCMILSCVPAISVAAAETAVIQDLEVEQRTTPMGIDNTTPEFRWEMVSDVRGQKQTAYQIVVKDGEETVWDSGKVESDVSNAIRYNGEALESSTRYTWTVTVWDKDGNQLPTQESWFEMGLLNQAADWEGAMFIAPSATEEVEEEETVDLTTDQYTIDFDFKIVQDNQGLAFGMKDSGTFVMWQVSTFESKDANQVWLRPHFKSGGSWVGYPGQSGYNVVAPNLTEKIGLTASELEGRTEPVHQRIVVSGNRIITYFGLNGETAETPTEDLILAYDFTYSGAASLPFYGIGFRQNNDGAGNSQEVAQFDNIIAKCNKTGDILYTNDFSNGKPGFAIANGKTGRILVTEDGWLEVGAYAQDSEQIYMQSTGSDASDLGGSSAPMFYKDFSVKEGLVSARLYATSLGIYEAYINGEKVGDQKMAPGWTNYHDYIQYQTYDVTDMLTAGDNAMGAIVGNGWYSGHVSTYGGVNKYGVDEAYIAQLVLTYEDGTTEKVVTDTSWKSYCDGPYVDTCNQNGETYDARKEVAGWATTEMDTSNWIYTKHATIDSINTEVDTENVALVAQPEEPARVIEELPVKFLAKTGDDTYVYDIGQNISGLVRITVDGEAGTTLQLRHGEMVYKDTNVLYTANLREAKATDYYTLKGGEGTEVYEPAFTFHGFRYFEVSGLGYQPAEEDIVALVVHSELDRTGWIETNNALINQLFSNTVWGMRDNYLSIPTDCPQRDERLGWTGDATTFSRTASMHYDIDAFYTKFVRDVHNAQLANGAIYDIAPAEGHSVGSGNHGWGDFAVVGPWTMFTTYGDTALLEEHWDMMTKWIAYYETKAEADLLLPSDSYGDWLAVESSPGAVTATAYFAYSTSLMAKMAEALGKTDEAAYYTNLFERIRTAFTNAYVNKSTGAINGNTQTIYAMAIYFDLIADDALRQLVIEKFIAEIEASNWYLTTGFLGCELLLPALTEAGYSEVAYQLLLNEGYPSWLYPVVNGATTIWERWNSYIAETGTFGDVGMNSFNHYSYGSVMEWMYQYAGGIQYDWENPGYKHFTIAPNPSKQLNDIKVEYESVYGRIVSDWTLAEDGTYNLSIAVPANTTATVVVPCDLESALTVDGSSPMAKAAGVTYLGTVNGKATFEVESGSYDFTSFIGAKVSVSAANDASAVGKALANYTINGAPTSFASVAQGSEVVVEATPINDAEWKFEKWVGSVESTDNPITLTVNENTNLSAVYTYIGEENLALGKAVTATSSDGNNAMWRPANLTDGNYVYTSNVNGWTSASINKNACNVSVQINLAATADIDEVHLYPRCDALTADGKPASFPKDFTVQVSSNGTDWQTVATYTDVAAPEVGAYFTAAFEPVNAQYVKINVTKSNDMAADDSVDRVQLCEIGIYGSNVQEIVYPVLGLDFAEAANQNRFTSPQRITVTKQEDSVLLTATSSSDPYVTINLSGAFAADAADYPYAVVIYKTAETNSAVATTAQMFYGAGTTTGPSEANSVKYNLGANGQWNGAILNLGQGAGWNGTPNFLRYDIFDSATAGDAVELKNIYLTHSLEQAQEIVDGLQADPDQEAADAVVALINAIGEVSLDSEAAIVEARAAYAALTDAQKALVANAAVLEAAEQTLAELKAAAEQEAADKAAAEAVDAQIAAIGEVTVDSKAAIEAARAAYEALTDAQKALVENLAVLEAAEAAYEELTKPVDPVLTDVTLALTGEELTNVNAEEVVYTVSAENMVNLATATLSIEVDDTYLTDPEAEGLNGWYVIAQTYNNGVLTVVMGNNAGANGAGDILAVTLKPTGEPGDATVAVTAAVLSAYEGDAEAYVNAILEGASVTTKVDYSVYDVNKDGVVNQLDLTRTQRWFGTDDAVCDVNDSGLVDINDMILILNNYTV